MTAGRPRPTHEGWAGPGSRPTSVIVYTFLLVMSGLILILVLWLSDGLGTTRPDIAGVALLLNLLCGGPLMEVWGGAIPPALRKGQRLFRWFNPQLS